MKPEKSGAGVDDVSDGLKGDLGLRKDNDGDGGGDVGGEEPGGDDEDEDVEEVDEDLLGICDMVGATIISVQINAIKLCDVIVITNYGKSWWRGAREGL